MQRIIKKFIFIVFPFFLICSITVIFIMPSAIHPNWAFLDDPTNMIIGASDVNRAGFLLPQNDSGRYCPAYHLYYSLLNRIFGYELSGYYSIQCVIFLFIGLLIYLTVKKIINNNWLAVFASLLFLTASPVAENAYTIGKPEPRILFLILLSIFFYLSLNSRKNIFLIVSNYIFILIVMITAIFTKETAIVIFVFPIAVMLLQKVLSSRRLPLQNQFLFFICSFIAITITRGLFYLLKSDEAKESYTSYPVNLNLILNNLKFYLHQQPDVIILGLISIVGLFWIFKRGIYKDNQSTILCFGFISTGFAYIAGLLIWRWPLGYYLLPPAAFFAIAVSIIVYNIQKVSRKSLLYYIVIVTILATRLYSVPYYIYIAMAQKYSNMIYTEAVKTYVKMAKPGQRLIVEQWSFFQEQTVQTQILIRDILGYKQLKVDGINDMLNGITLSSEIISLYNVKEIPDKNQRMPRKNDFLLLFSGKRSSSWILRGVSPFQGTERSELAKNGAKLEPITMNKIIWKGFDFSPTSPIPEIKSYSTGFILSKIIDPSWKIIWENRWKDHWIGRNASCKVNIALSDNLFLLEGSANTNSIPNKLIILKDEEIIKTVSIEKSGKFIIPIKIENIKQDQVAHFNFRTESTFNPKKLELSSDDRNLAIQLDIKPFPEIVWYERWEDQWIGKKATCLIRSDALSNVFQLTGFVPKENVPNKLIIKIEDTPLRTINILNPGSFSTKLILTQTAKNGNNDYSEIHFIAQKTFNPALNGISTDSRDLSFQINIKKLSEE